MLALLGLFVVSVLGISSGNTTACDAVGSTWGCLAWGVKQDPLDGRRYLTNRLNCTNAGRLMAWAAAPIRSDFFTVRSGNEGPITTDVAFYHPGEYMTIWVRANTYKKRYRGLLLYAVNSANTVVGKFEFAPETEAVPFWTPTAWQGVCASAGLGNAVLHKNADEKPYTIGFRWKAPAQGTGSVTFRALFKAGPANDGDFHWPSNGGRGDLTLSERNPAVDGAVPPLIWFQANSASDTCATVCTANNRSGVDTNLMAATTDGGDGMSTYHPSAADAFYRSSLCRFPFVSSCAADAPAIDTASKYCYYKPATCPSWRNTNVASSRRRMCACLTAPSQNLPCPVDSIWPSTPAGSTATLPCPTNQTGNNTRPCSATGTWGTAVSTCVAVASCSDGVMNQGEVGIDCGGPCPKACLNCPTTNCGTYGTCVEGSPATCTCNSGYTGNRCEVPPASPCASWNCSNGGTCQVQNAVATCVCTAPYMGPHCDMLPAPTCTDGLKNQNESGVDCGGPCPACDSFFWEVGVWTACDRACGGGMRTRGQTCKNSTGQVRPSTDCAGLHPPITQETCNPDPCPTYTWVAGSWGTCSTSCGGGNQTRAVDCWSSVGPSIVTTPGLCDEASKPSTYQACNTAACQAPRWVSDPWGACSMACGGGSQTRINRCMNPSNVEVQPSNCAAITAPASQQACNIFACITYSWYLCPNWGPCTATCGGGDGMLGQQYRGLFCQSSDGKQVDFSLCDPTTRPVNVLTVCNTWPCTDFNWMANGDWSACNGTHRNRAFHCHAKDGSVAIATQCSHVPLPMSSLPCTPGQIECSDIPPTPYGGLSAAPKLQTSVPFLLAALSSVVSSPRLGLVSVGLLALSFVVPTEAHNWMHTPGRASFMASTIAPCQARKDSDLHQQVIRGQRFTMRFATGHDRDSYFVTVAGGDEDKLAYDNFEAMVDDYIALAPSEDHLTDYNRRYHGYLGTRGSEYTSTTVRPGSMFSGQVASTAANFPSHTRENATAIFRYNDNELQSDKRVSYVSAKYPWIISAARLPHLYHLPDDFDAFFWAIPDQSNVPDGHIIVHWRWSGYYDCIDVDLRPKGSPSVPFPDGQLNASAHIWSQLDHCQYEQPATYLTRCMEVFDSVQPCIRSVPQGDWNVNSRLGVNVVPFRNPASVNPNFAQYVNIPWRRGECSSSWNQLPGTVAETQLDWTAWLAKTNVATGQDCANGMTELWNTDLKRAIGYCVGLTGCTGISWETQAGKNVQSVTDGHFKMCENGAGTANSAYNFYSPKALTKASYQTNTVKMINFAESYMLNYTTAAANMITDSGYVYGSGGRTFGWHCATQLTCDWCCSQWSCQNDPSQQCCGGSPDWTFLYSPSSECPENIDLRTSFDFDLANGVYEITTRHQGLDNFDVDLSGCNVENTHVIQTRGQPTPAGTQSTFLVEVTDGKLNFNGDAGQGYFCSYINWIKYQYKGPVGTWDDTWMPPAKANPVWEQNAGSPVPIGLVTLTNYEPYKWSDNTPVCSAWWLFKGSGCYPNKPSNWFNNTASEGAIVGVSNSSCLSGSCPGFVECGKIQLAKGYWERDYFVDCLGKVGQYVSVKLPGSSRYLTVDVAAYLYMPLVPANDNPLVCFGVEARQSGPTTPEYIISMDPEDPIFYSTCYVRNPNIIWLSTGPQPTVADRWRFNGRCITCDSYQRNHQTKVDFAAIPAPWVITDGKCVDCDAENVPLTPPATTWTTVYLSECDDPVTDTTNRGLPSCSTAPFTSCLKDLYGRGRQPQIDGWASVVLTESECQAVAARDPECTSAVQYVRGADYGWSACKCFRSHSCCGRCTPGTWSGSTVRNATPVGYYVLYDRSVSQTPDPFCSSGLKSADGKLCCTNDCKSATGTSVCGVASTCKTAAGGGVCCLGDQMNLFASPCSVTGPPCRLT